MSSALEDVAASAVSLVVAGNTGILPFLTLLLVGIVERSDPELLNMDKTVEKIVASDGGLAVLSIATVAEFVALCIPVVDEFVDSAMTFVIPFLSVLGSIATFGLFSKETAEELIDTIEDQQEGDERQLQAFEDEDNGKLGLQIFLTVFGVILALTLHLFEIVVRFFGEACCLAPCLTVMETFFTVATVFVAVYFQEVAIAISIFLLLVGVYAAKRLYERRKKRLEENEEGQGETGDQPSPSNSPVTAPVDLELAKAQTGLAKGDVSDKVKEKQTEVPNKQEDADGEKEDTNK